VQNVHRSNAVRESLQSFSESQKLLLEDFSRQMQPMVQGWAEEQRLVFNASYTQNLAIG
jgi:hypothetical protein